jgi:hypothetical protein
VAKVPRSQLAALMMMVAPNTSLSSDDAERLRSFERRRHDHLATTYHGFFTPITMLAIKPLFDAIRLQADVDLLDIATGTGSLAAGGLAAGRRSILILRMPYAAPVLAGWAGEDAVSSSW